MVEARKIANNMTNTRTKAIAYCSEVKEQFFDDIRYHADKLETLVSDDKLDITEIQRTFIFEVVL